MRHGKRAKDFNAVIAAPFGRVGFMLEGDAITDISFLDKNTPLSPPRTPQARKISRALKSYFDNPGTTFRLPLRLDGTPFQQRVWRALRRIPAGQTLSYGVLAKKLDTSARAVGNACRANPVPIIVPCHRVVGSGYGDVQGRISVAGSRKLRATMGGFMGKRSGSPLNLKHWLLAHERKE